MLFKRALSIALGMSLIFSGFLLLAPSENAQAATNYTAYVMGYFTESPQQLGANYGLHLAYSTDALNWTPLNNNQPVMTPNVGVAGLRDPFIFRKQDGTFVILATNMAGTNFSDSSEYIHAWDSTDLITFSNERLLRLNTTGMHTWAPEAFYDASRGQYGIIWSGNTDRNRIYVNYTTDFMSVGTPQVYFDPGFSVLDATMHMSGGTNYLYYKKESENALYGAKSTSLNPGSFNSATYTGAIYHDVIEAPIVVRKINQNRWYLYGDSYYPVNGVFYAWESANIGSNAWTELNQRNYSPPLNAKHATIAQITQTELNNLISHWGNPNWNRIQSYNFPDRYIRHESFQGRIDAYPFDPYTDAQFKIVAGLADSSGVSFESVSYPGYYLRHSNYNLVLNQTDGSSIFKADATFYKVSGLADAGWSSFQSYNFPDRYIRHANFVLGITTISTTLDKQDATFKIGY